MFSWLLVLVVLMAGGGNGGKRRRSSAQQPVEQPAEEEESKYNPGDDSGRESQEEEFVSAQVETCSKRKEQAKGKGKEKDKGKGKEKVPDITTAEEQRTYIRGRKQTGGISFYEPGDVSPPRAPQAPVDPKHQRMYSTKQCVGERAVGVASLFEKVPGFQALFETGNLREICDFPETTGYRIELIREFYMRAGHLLESESGPFTFITSVRGVDLMISPKVIGNVLEMPVWTGGIDYLNAGFDLTNDWTRVLRSICIEGAKNNGSAILSKDLRFEYRFLNFVVCYNIMPLANTKVIRWDQVLYMYLLGRPNIIQERNLNLNTPFLIWKRMAREIKTANQKDRLPYPLLIMRILRLHNVNVTCSSYERSLGPIGDTTMANLMYNFMDTHHLIPRLLLLLLLLLLPLFLQQVLTLKLPYRQFIENNDYYLGSLKKSRRMLLNSTKSMVVSLAFCDFFVLRWDAEAQRCLLQLATPSTWWQAPLFVILAISDKKWEIKEMLRGR